MSDLHEIKELVDNIADDWKAHREQQEVEQKALRQQVDELEAALELAANTGGGSFGKGTAAKRYREIWTPDGEKAFELRGKDRFSDIPAFRGKSEVGIDRLFGALVFGSDSGDKEAVEAAAELKSVGTGTSGITLENTVASQWIDMVRAQSVLFAAGGRSVSMPTQSLSYIHTTSDPTASWRSSEGASLSATDPGFAARTLTARTLAVRTQISLEGIQDVPQAGSQMAQQLAAAMAAEIDSAAFIGSSPAPTGIHNMSGVGKVTSVGTPTNWDEIVSGVTAFLNANNALDDLTGIVMHPNVWDVYAKLKTGISSDNTPLELPPAIANVPRYVSTGADEVASPEDYHVTLGNFSDLLVGFRMNPTVRILDQTSYASNLLIDIVGVLRADVVALRPASFVVLEDVTTT
ncbi:phage major capsid protein [Lentisalinibacter salinarum]|uniref:phage major capsid protein n=1 Tax=Lentisalinibacter salinarum TaxID=2992239 RepID=UPI0038633702